VDRICRAVLFWRCLGEAAPNRALIHLGAKLTWARPRFRWEAVVAGVDDAGPQSATAATIRLQFIGWEFGHLSTVDEWSSGIAGSGVE
jgi:hypothetical protein